MRKNLLRIFTVLIGLALGTVTTSAKNYTSVCSGDIEDGNTWGVDPKTFKLNADDNLLITHEVYIGTKYLNPDVEVNNLQVTSTGKLLIHYSGDPYSTMRGLNVHGTINNEGCIGFDRLGSFSAGHDAAVAGGYGRLFLHIGGDLNNYGIINVNSMTMYGKNPKIKSFNPIQATELSFKDIKGKLTAEWHLEFYNTNMSAWTGNESDATFEGLDMGNYTLTLSADAPKEPSVWWYGPEWNGCMTDMKVLFGDMGGGIIVNDCYVKNCSFVGGLATITVGSDSGKHAFFFERNVFKGNVFLNSDANIHVACTYGKSGFEVDGDLSSTANVNASNPVYPGKGVDGTDYVMTRVGDKGRMADGDIFVHGNFFAIGNFGTGYVDEGNYDAHVKLHIYTLGDDVTVSGIITAETILTQLHPADEEDHLAYGGEPFAKRGSVKIETFLTANRYPIKVNTTFIVEGFLFNEAEPCAEPLIVDNSDLGNETGIRNGLIINKGQITCRYNTRKDWGNMMCLHIDFPNWHRWRFNGNNSDMWQIDDYLGYLEVREIAQPNTYGLSAPRYWRLALLDGPAYNSCLHDLTLSYEDEDMLGINENDLAVYQSLDNGKSWQQISNDENTIREPEKNKISIGKYSSKVESLVDGFGMFAISQPGLNGIIEVTTDAKSSHSDSTFDITGREVNASYKGIVIKNGKKMVQ